MTVAVKSLMMEGADHAMSVDYFSHVKWSGLRFTDHCNSLFRSVAASDLDCPRDNGHATGIKDRSMGMSLYRFGAFYLLNRLRLPSETGRAEGGRE